MFGNIWKRRERRRELRGRVRRRGMSSDDGGRTVGAEASEATDGNGAAAAADRAAGEEAG